jgi:hypothetical protein
MGGKGPGGFQEQTGTLDPAARQRVEDSQKAVFGMITQLRDSLPGEPTTPASTTSATAPAPGPVSGPVSGGATEAAEPATPGGSGAVTPDTSTSTGDMLATAVTTPDSGPAPGTKPKSRTIVTQT